jgi:hypothetical protein
VNIHVTTVITTPENPLATRMSTNAYISYNVMPMQHASALAI